MFVLGGTWGYEETEVQGNKEAGTSSPWVSYGIRMSTQVPDLLVHYSPSLLSLPSTSPNLNFYLFMALKEENLNFLLFHSVLKPTKIVPSSVHLNIRRKKHSRDHAVTQESMKVYHGGDLMITSIASHTATCSAHWVWILGW